MLRMTTRIFAAGVLAATLASVNLSASACEDCMKSANLKDAKMSASKSAAFKSNVESAKLKVKTSAAAKLTPKTVALKSGEKKTADAPMCPQCQKAAAKDKI